jgi:Glycosyltransferase
MKIWILNHYAIPPSMGGLVRHYYFSKYLQEKGHSVKIFSSSKIHNTKINMIQGAELYCETKIDEIEYTFIRSKEYKGNGIDRILNMVDFPFKMWKAMKLFFEKSPPDVIYTSSPDLFVAFFALLFGKRRNIPVVVEIRDLWPESLMAYGTMSRYNPIAWLLSRLEKWIYIKSDKLIFLMEGWHQYFIEQGWESKIDLSKVSYISNGVDLGEYDHNKGNFQLEDSDLNDMDSFKVVYMGSIRLVNNLGTLIDAAKVLKQRGITNIKILIFGDGTEKDNLEAECKKHQLDVIFKGRIEKKYIPYILSVADVNLISVKKSNLGVYGCSWNKLFEYMASGKPIISNAPMAYDLIKKHQLGIVQSFETPEEYADAILQTSHMTNEERAVIAKKGREIAKEFDYKELTEKLNHIFEEI